MRTDHDRQGPPPGQGEPDRDQRVHDRAGDDAHPEPGEIELAQEQVKGHQVRQAQQATDRAGVQERCEGAIGRDPPADCGDRVDGQELQSLQAQPGLPVPGPVRMFAFRQLRRLGEHAGGIEGAQEDEHAGDGGRLAVFGGRHEPHEHEHAAKARDELCDFRKRVPRDATPQRDATCGARRRASRREGRHRSAHAGGPGVTAAGATVSPAAAFRATKAECSANHLSSGRRARASRSRFRIGERPGHGR